MTLPVPPSTPAQLYHRVKDNIALPVSLLSPQEQQVLPGLLAEADLQLWQPTRIGPIVTLGDSNGRKRWVEPPAFRSPWLSPSTRLTLRQPIRRSLQSPAPRK